MQWYYSKQSTQLGPVSHDELRAKLASGEVSGSDMVWREGLPDWRPASSMPELLVSRVTPPAVPQMGGAVNSPYTSPSVVPHIYAPPPPTSGLAIASLVCGLLGLITCTFVPGIPAVICGHMALSRMANPMVRLSGRGLAIAGLVTGYLSVVGLLGFIGVLLLGIASS